MHCSLHISHCSLLLWLFSSSSPVNLLDFRVDRSLVAIGYGATVQIIFLLVTGDLNLGIHVSNTAGEKWLASKLAAAVSPCFFVQSFCLTPCIIYVEVGVRTPHPLPSFANLRRVMFVLLSSLSWQNLTVPLPGTLLPVLQTMLCVR